jgi:hypothetical protein
VTAPRLAVIQHHPSRRELVRRLVDSLEGFRVEIVESERRSPPSPWATYRRCLELACDLACDGYTHATILQDDATVCTAFAQELDTAVDALPDAVLVLFLASSPRALADLARLARSLRADYARLPPSRLIPPTMFLPAVAVTWPMDAVADVLDWQEKYAGVTRRSDDHMLGRWAADEHRTTPIAVTVPSLVQHPDDVYSLVGNGSGARGRNPARSALFFAG